MYNLQLLHYFDLSIFIKYIWRQIELCFFHSPFQFYSYSKVSGYCPPLVVNACRQRSVYPFSGLDPTSFSTSEKGPLCPLKRLCWGLWGMCSWGWIEEGNWVRLIFKKCWLNSSPLEDSWMDLVIGRRRLKVSGWTPVVARDWEGTSLFIYVPK